MGVVFPQRTFELSSSMGPERFSGLFLQASQSLMMVTKAATYQRVRITYGTLVSERRGLMDKRVCPRQYGPHESLNWKLIPIKRTQAQQKLKVVQAEGSPETNGSSSCMAYIDPKSSLAGLGNPRRFIVRSCLPDPRTSA